MATKTQITFTATAVASGTTGTETAITLRRSSGTSATTSAASFAPTTNKTLCINSITFAARGNNTATAQVTTFSIRINTSGAVTTTSTPILLSARVATPATANSWDRITIPINEPYEIWGDGTLQIGVTANAVFVTNAPTWDVLITGYEY